MSEKSELVITSQAFNDGQFIPRKYTGEGADISPPLSWGPGPEGTKSFALINDDPDAPAGTWVHWVIYNISPDAASLPEAVAAEKVLPDGAIQGMTDFGRVGYGGPMPPPGSAHRYFFKLYALDCVVDLAPAATKSELVSAMKGHILAQTELVGLYKRGSSE